MAGDELQGRGWSLTENGIAQCTENAQKKDINSIIKVALDTDLRDIGKGWLPEEMSRGRADYVEGPGVLQLQKIRNTSAPKDHEESQAAPRLMKLVLTDGQITCNAVEMEPLKDIGLNTPPGCKLKLKVTTDVEHGFLLLNNKNTQLLGGRVEKMAESWELKKSLAKQPRASQSEGGPPLFVPFGKRIGDAQYRQPQAGQRDNFKSLGGDEKKEKKAEDGEFEQQRQATIKEALQAKDSKAKTFGGKQVSDYSVAQVTEMGFDADEASTALKFSGGNVQQALEYLLNNKCGGQRGGHDIPNRGDKGRGRRGRDGDEEGSGPGRGRRGRDDEAVDEASSRPSGPATLFDFVENKMPAKAEKSHVEKKEHKPPQTSQRPSSSVSSSSSYQDQPSHGHSQSQGHNQGQRYNQGQGYTQGQGHSQGQGHTQGQGYNHGQGHSQDQGNSQGQGHNQTRQRPPNQHQESWSHGPAHGQPNRRQQNIPPRFVNKPKFDSDYSQGEGHYQDDRPRTAPSENRNYSEKGRNYNKNNNAAGKNSYQKSFDDNQRNSYNNRNSSASSYDTGQNEKSDFEKTHKDSQQRGFNKENQSDDPQYVRENTSKQSRNPSFNGNKKDSYDKSNSQGNYQGGTTKAQTDDSKQQAYEKKPQRYDERPQNVYSDNGSNNTSRRQDTYQGPPVPSYPAQNDFVYRNDSGPGFALKAGDRVLAKYWEDGMFYDAMIEVVAQSTCVVTFLEYGNSEEVLLSDISPIQQMSLGIPQQPNLSVPPPQMFYPATGPQHMGPLEDSQSAMNSIEFRRGGGGAAYTRKRDDGRPPQQLYQPPPQRR